MNTGNWINHEAVLSKFISWLKTMRTETHWTYRFYSILHSILKDQKPYFGLEQALAKKYDLYVSFHKRWADTNAKLT